MNRREALALTAKVIGVTIVGSEVFLSGCSTRKESGELFSKEDIRLLNEIGETILPESAQSPGAKAAHIGAFMTTIVTDCYAQDEAAKFTAGIREIKDASREKYNLDFMELSPPRRLELLTEFDSIARNQSNSQEAHFFSMMKQLTIWGYFTSEPGATKALRYNPVPGGFEGCVPYEKEDKAWA